MKILSIVLISLQLLILGCTEKPLFIDYKNENIQYDGRIDSSSGEKAELSWAGSAAKIRFKGNGVKVLLQNRNSPSYLDVIVDDDSMFVIQSDSVKRWFTLAENLPSGEHSVMIFKRTDNGDLWLYGFQLDSGAELIAPEKRTRVMEYIGDSITHGSSINDTTGKGNRWRGLFSDNYNTYAALTARYFKAKYYCIAVGGVGIMVGGNKYTSGDFYYRWNVRNTEKRWDFSKIQPDIVVINLFQNDYYIIDKRPDHPHFINKFGKEKPSEEYIVNAYIEFVTGIKKHYPKAKIICALGSMDVVKEGSAWPGYIKKAVEKMNNPDVYFLLFPYKNTPGHPNVKEHHVMADTLIYFIKRNHLFGNK